MNASDNRTEITSASETGSKKPGTAFRLLLLLSALLATFILASAHGAAVQPIEITLSLDKSSASAGDTVTATYSVTGGNGTYKTIEAIWNTETGGARVGSDWIKLAGNTGTYSYKPTMGEWLNTDLLVRDSDGRQAEKYSADIPLSGFPVVAPIEITLSLDKSSAKAGETVTATYSITGGSGTYRMIEAIWNTETGGARIGSDWQKLAGSSGTYSFTPTAGEWLNTDLLVRDSDGRQAEKYSADIPLNGFPVIEPIEITLSLDKSSVNVGEEVTATYSVTGGNGTYKMIEAIWNTESAGARISSDWIKLTGNTGTYSFTPSMGEWLNTDLLVRDSDGRQAEKYSRDIPVEGADDLPPPTATPKPNDQVTPLNVEISLDKVAINVGETLTASYEINGGSGVYYEISWYWVVDSAGANIYTDTKKLPSSTGTFTYTPTLGEWVKAGVYVQDSDGREHSEESNDVPIKGAEVIQPLNIEITINEPAINVGEVLTASYKISGGSGAYYEISSYWVVDSGGANIYTDTKKLPSSAGTFTYTPTLGEWVKAGVYVQDSDGREHSAESNDVPIKGAEVTQPLNIEITVNVPAINVGEVLTASYKITGGSGAYYEISSYWVVDSAGANIYTDTKKLPSSAGTFTYTPTLGEWVKAGVYVQDSDGREHSAESNDVPISGEQLSTLPGDANVDGEIDLEDLVALIDYLVSGKAPTSMENANADKSADGVIDLQDLVWIIDKIIAG
ncbi:MAG: dockerin type I repeat-containing protein [Christensenellales bacterium]